MFLISSKLEWKKNPFFDESVPTNPLIVGQLKKYLRQFPEVTDRLGAKLSEVEKISPITGWLLTEAFRLYSFRVVEETLVNVHDDDSVVEYPDATLVQLAVRRSQTIFINGKWWPSLSVDQKVALLIHEIVYAFQLLPMEMSQPGSILARATVGFLFTSDIRDRGHDGLLLSLHSGSRLYKAAQLVTSPIIGAHTQALGTYLILKGLSFYSADSWEDDDVPHHLKFVRDIPFTATDRDLARLCKKSPVDSYLERPYTEFAENPAEGLIVKTHIVRIRQFVFMNNKLEWVCIDALRGALKNQEL